MPTYERLKHARDAYKRALARHSRASWDEQPRIDKQHDSRRTASSDTASMDRRGKPSDRENPQDAPLFHGHSNKSLSGPESMCGDDPSPQATLRSSQLERFRDAPIADRVGPPAMAAASHTEDEYDATLPIATQRAQTTTSVVTSLRDLRSLCTNG